MTRGSLEARTRRGAARAGLRPSRLATLAPQDEGLGSRAPALGRRQRSRVGYPSRSIRHDRRVSRPPLEIQVRVADSLKAVAAAQWDASRTPARCPARRPAGAESAETHNPFVSHAFLSALEDSGCVGGRTGWQPVHLLVEAGAGEVVAAAPCYAKSHSQGEYVFDHGWADAYERAGGRYYPKLQVSVPFTPVTGPRLLVSPGAEPRHRAGGARRRPAGAAREDRRLVDPLTFLPKADWDALGERRAAAARRPAVPLAATTATPASTISWRRSPRASARRSGASGATRSAPGSPSRS